MRHLFAIQPQLLSPVLQVIHRALSTFVIHQAGLTHVQAQTGAVTLIQCFGSAANLNIHLHCLLLDVVYRLTDGVPIFQPAPAPSTEQLQALLTRIITRLLLMLTRHGALMEARHRDSLPDQSRSRSRPGPATCGRLHLPALPLAPGQARKC